MQEYREHQIQRVNPVYSGQISQYQQGQITTPYPVYDRTQSEIQNQKVRSWTFLLFGGTGVLFGLAAFAGAIKPERPIVISPAPVVSPSPATPQNITQPSCTSLCFGG